MQMQILTNLGANVHEHGLLWAAWRPGERGNLGRHPLCTHPASPTQVGRGEPALHMMVEVAVAPPHLSSSSSASRPCTVDPEEAPPH